MCCGNCSFRPVEEKCAGCVKKENGLSPLPSIMLLHRLVGTSGSAAKQVAVKKARAPIKRKRPTKKCVRFCHLYDKVNFRHASSEDLEKSWHQPEDYNKFKSEVCDIVLQANAVTNTKQSSGCIRGLEFMVSIEARKTRQKWIEETVKGVLLSQGIQKLLGLSNPDQLCETATAASRHSRDFAVMLASIDQKERCS